MRKALVIVCAVAAALVAAATVSASSVRADPVVVDVPPTLETYYSGVCGFDVYWQLSGTAYTTLVMNKDGVVVSQIDTYSPDWLYTLTAPSKQTALPLNSAKVFHYTYPEGATLGAPVELVVTGMNDKYPGLPAAAGRQLYSGHVTGFLGQVPQWEGIWGGAEWIDFVGQWNDQSQVDAVVCATLGT